MHSDPIADLLTRIRNASKVRKLSVTAPYSNIKESILKILKQRKFIADYKINKESKFPELQIALNPEIEDLTIRRVSTPGQRIYIKSGEIKKVRNGLGLSIISTPKGLLPGEEAYKQKVGGEVICEVY